MQVSEIMLLKSYVMFHWFMCVMNDVLALFLNLVRVFDASMIQSSVPFKLGWF